MNTIMQNLIVICSNDSKLLYKILVIDILGLEIDKMFSNTLIDYTNMLSNF